MYSYRLLTGYHAQNFDDWALLIHNHLINSAPQENLFQPNDPWITNENDTKTYMLEHLDNTELSKHNTLPHLLLTTVHTTIALPLKILPIPSVDDLLILLIQNPP